MATENIPPELPKEEAKRPDAISLDDAAYRARGLLRDEHGEISTSGKVVLGLVTAASVAAVAAYEATRPTGNVYERGQAFLAEAAEPVPIGKSNNYVELGKTIVIKVKSGEPPLVLYHTPRFGFSKIKPKKADRESMADPLVIKPGDSAVFTDLRKIGLHDQSKQPDVYAMNLAGIKTKFNRATDAALNFFITDQEMRERGAVPYTPGGRQTRLVLAEVNNDGNLVISGLNGQLEASSSIKIIPNKELPQYLEENGLEPEASSR